MTRTELIESTSEKVLSGESSTTAANVRELLEELINSCANLEDDANAAGGFPLIDEDEKINSSLIKSDEEGGFPLIDEDGKINSNFITSNQNGGFPLIASGKIARNYIPSSTAGITSGSVLTNADDAFVYTSGTGDVTLMAKGGNRTYDVANIGNGTLTLNYPGGGSLIFDMATGLAASSADVPTMKSVRIIDNNTYLIVSNPF